MLEELSDTLAKFGDDAVADYKIEIQFAPGKRSLTKDSAAAITTWLSGKQLSGDNDVGMFWCIDAEAVLRPSAFKRLVDDIRRGEGSSYGCGKLIPPDHVGPDMATCPSCGRKQASAKLAIALLFSGSMEDLAYLLTHFFHTLRGSVDFYLKSPRNQENLRQMTEAAREKSSFKAKQALNRQAVDYELAIYPLKNILKDRMMGLALDRRIKAFLTS